MKYWFIGTGAAMALLIIFLFQRINYIDAIWGFFTGSGTGWPRQYEFIVNRGIRFIINDFFAIVLIYSLFAERKYVLFAVAVQLVGFLLIFLPYAILKLNFPQYNGALVSFLHRLIINPTLLMLLIPILFYQKKLQKQP